MRKLINWLFGNKRIKELELENIKLRARGQYMPVEIYKGVFNNETLMAPELLQSIYDLGGNSYFIYFMFDLKEQIIKDKDNYTPVQFVATLKVFDLISESIKAYSESYVNLKNSEVA